MGMNRTYLPEGTKVGYCQGRKVSYLRNCKLFAGLKRVYVPGGSLWLCGRCIQKIRDRNKGKAIIRDNYERT